MKVTLKSHTALAICSDAIRTCWQSQDKSDTSYGFDESKPNDRGEAFLGKKDKELIDRVGNKFKHASTLEHLVYSFYIQDVSRTLLQEFARHRIASLSVKSTRYTLKELKDEEPFCEVFTNIPDRLLIISVFSWERANKYIKLTGDTEIDERSVLQLELLRLSVASGKSNDLAKYNLPECYKTELHWTINARSLQNFLRLRTNKSALWEIRDLAKMIYDNLPSDHKYLFEECVGG